jgi:hypothetical protein
MHYDIEILAAWDLKFVYSALISQLIGGHPYQIVAIQPQFSHLWSNLVEF